MRKFLKNNILEIFKTMYEAHDNIKKLLNKKDFDNVQILLGDCQSTAVRIGEIIEKSEGEGFITVSFLEEYCEALYEVAANLSEASDGYKVRKNLDKKIIRAENSAKNDIKVKLEIVFLPYKVSMWDSLESIWMAAKEDPDCSAYVVPIPYYDRNPDHSFGELHYEGEEYPDYVPVVHYEAYNLKQRRPDVIYIHNPYDDNNYVTSVDPRFYSGELKKYTDCLVYVPYFLFPKMSTSNLINTPVLFNADYIIAQNEKVRDDYINEIKKFQKFRHNFESNILALGTPKTDKIFNICRNGINVPEQWSKQAKDKKKIFLNTNVSLILNNNEKFIENLVRVFQILDRRNDVFIIWREHPLTNATLKSMKPGMLTAYEKLKSVFIKRGLGVLDTNAEAYEAIYFSDCYFGAGGSLAPIYAATGKPMLLTAYNYPGNISDKEAPLSFLMKQAERSIYFSERYANFLDMFIDNLEILMKYKNKRLEFLSEITLNINGMVGAKIMSTIKNAVYN